MNGFIEALLNPSIPFIRYALIASMVSSIPLGIIGSFVVVKRISYIAGSLSHSVLGGIGLALYLSATTRLDIPPMAGAFLAAFLSALIIAYAVVSKTERLDTIIGAIWAVGMSLGLIFIYKTPGYVEPMSYLFGNILLITKADLILILLLNVLVLLLSVFFYNQILAISFDEEFARIRGLNTAFIQVVLILLVALSVILMIRVVGIIMVIALLTLPPAISGFFARRLKTTAFISSIVCVTFMILGLFFGYITDLPVGALTVSMLGVLYLILFVAFRAKFAR